MDAWFALNVPPAQKSFWTYPTGLLGDVGHVESGFGMFGHSVNVSARRTVCTKRTIGSEIVLATPYGTPR
jgi:murein DD-endopeptidase MepM/ murein hydrolase activator NlpD